MPVTAISFTTELTVGTAVVVIYTTEGSAIYTTTQTVYDSISQDYDLYRQFTDDSGTVFVELPPKTISDEVLYSELAYPTQLIDYDAKYSWEGVLPTSGDMTAFACATATSEPSVTLLADHPPFPPPTNIVANPNDPGGQEHQPIWVPLDIEPEYSFFKDAFPSESAFVHCESAARSQATTTIYSMPRFTLDHTTMYRPPRSDRIIHTESTATGWEETKPRVPPTGDPITSAAAPHTELTVDDFGETSPPTPQQTDGPPVIRTEAPVVHVEASASGFDQTLHRQQTADPGSPYQAPTDAFAEPTPVFTYIPTTIDGQSTNVVAFVLPDSSATVTIGQTITLDGQLTVLTIPEVLFTAVVSGTTTTPVYIISGSITATIGQTVTLDDATTILSTPTHTRVDQRPGDAKATSDTRPSTSSDPADSTGAADRVKFTCVTVLVGISGLFVFKL